MVRIQNHGDRVFLGEYANQKYHLQPGQEMVAPYMAMCLWMGHPEAFDVPNDRERSYRTDEFARLTTRYGIYDDAWQVYDDDAGPYAGQTVWQAHIPKIKALHITDGTPLVTVLDDPSGESMSEGAQQIRQQQSTQSMMAAMAQQIEQLQTQLAAMSADPSTPIVTLPPEHGQTNTKAVAPTAQPGIAPDPSTIPGVGAVPNIMAPGVQAEPAIPEDAPQRTKIVS